MFKKFIAFITVLSLSAALCACGGEKSAVKRFNSKHEKKLSQSFTAAENESYSLSWDSEHYRVLLTDKRSGRVWSTLPSGLQQPRYDEDGFEENNHPHTETPLTLEYVDTETLQIELLYAYTGSLKKGDYAIEQLKDGLEITYYFSKQEISVPVKYTLLADGINISVDPNKITENEEYIYRIILSPFFASAENTAQEDYLFVPSGSGALIYPRDWSADTSYTASYPVYGTDLVSESIKSGNVNNTEPVRLPVFGAKTGADAVCGIIEDGAECASIECNVGNTSYGYSSAYAAFQIRGFFSNTYSKNTVSSKLSVSYYPLAGENANYIGMADRYRKYLAEKYGLKETTGDTALSLKLIGGTHVSAQALGVPYNKLFVTTSLKEAENIVEKIYGKTGISPAVQLVGYGESGIDTDRIGGGYKVAAAVGGKKQLKSLAEFCESINSPLYFDFDIVYFARSGGGIRKMFDYAVTPVGQRALRYKTEFGTGNGYANKEYFIMREKLASAGEKSADTVKKLGLDGLSFNTASAGAYSDYADRKYYVKSGFAVDYAAIAEKCRRSGLKLLGDNANAYSAVYSSLITCAPTQSAENDLFTADIPFYEIVFKGYVPMTADAVNLSIEPKTAVLRAAEAGCGLSYTLTARYDKSLMTAKQTLYHSTAFSGLDGGIYETVAAYNAYFESIKNAKIISHKILENGLRKTEFDNGTAVYVNYGSTRLTSEAGEVAAGSYIFTKGEKK